MLQPAATSVTTSLALNAGALGGMAETPEIPEGFAALLALGIPSEATGELKLDTSSEPVTSTLGQTGKLGGKADGKPGGKILPDLVPPGAGAAAAPGEILDLQPTRAGEAGDDPAHLAESAAEPILSILAYALPVPVISAAAAQVDIVGTKRAAIPESRPTQTPAAAPQALPAPLLPAPLLPAPVPPAAAPLPAVALAFRPTTATTSIAAQRTIAGTEAKAPASASETAEVTAVSATAASPAVRLAPLPIAPPPERLAAAPLAVTPDASPASPKPVAMAAPAQVAPISAETPASAPPTQVPQIVQSLQAPMPLAVSLPAAAQIVLPTISDAARPTPQVRPVQPVQAAQIAVQVPLSQPAKAEPVLPPQPATSLPAAAEPAATKPATASTAAAKPAATAPSIDSGAATDSEAAIAGSTVLSARRPETAAAAPAQAAAGDAPMPPATRSARSAPAPARSDDAVSAAAPRSLPLTASVAATDPATPIAAELQPILAMRDAQPAQTGANAQAAAPTPSIQNGGHDFAALVDRLVEARDATTPQAVRAAIQHVDFGQVSLNFKTDDARLTVSMASADPDFAPAVQAAAAMQANTSADNGPTGHRQETQSQQQSGGSSTTGQPQTQAQTQAQTQSQAQSQGSPRDAERERSEISRQSAGNHDPAQAQDEARSGPRGGIYA